MTWSDVVPCVLPALLGSALIATGAIAVDNARRGAVRVGAWVAGLAGIALNVTVITDLLAVTSIWT